ncbi:hypothetical protein VTI28DRAFT_5655 [Corynascus sepedonium]
MDWHWLWQQSLTFFSRVTPAEWCQTIFLLSAGGVLAVAVLPYDIKIILVNYGARKTQDPSANGPSQEFRGRGWLLSFIDTITSWSQVPHSWFGTFYVVSVTCSLFWLVQYLVDGAVLRCVAEAQAGANGLSATLGQVTLGWFMMFLQGARRTLEHWTIMKQSRSTIWVVHWLLGLLFYLAISVSVWVEGSHAFLNPADYTDDAQSVLKMAVAFPIFMFAWVNQYRCHKHLAGLKKYSLPTAGMFRHYICPHYTCECLLYLSMAIATAPRGAWFNRTLVCALIFVAINLGVTASGTRKWYAERFGIGSVAMKWNMVPFIF